MLHITSSKLKSAQWGDEFRDKHEDDYRRYRGNPMGITTQCEACGAYYDQVRGELHPCEFCQKEFCPNCLGPHEQEHMAQLENNLE